MWVSRHSVVLLTGSEGMDCETEPGCNQSCPATLEDLAATLFWALGIKSQIRLPDSQGRPVQVVEGGRPLTEMFG